jgi:hypothetical protein
MQKSQNLTNLKIGVKFVPSVADKTELTTRVIKRPAYITKLNMEHKMTNLVDLQATLPTLTKIDFKRNDNGDLDMIELQVKPHSMVRDGYLYISMERGDGAGNCDTLEVNSKLEAWARELGTYWEWQDNGTIVLSN